MNNSFSFFSKLSVILLFPVFQNKYRVHTGLKSPQISVQVRECSLTLNVVAWKVFLLLFGCPR